MKKLTLSPYPGFLFVCKNISEYRKKHIKMLGYFPNTDGVVGQANFAQRKGSGVRDYVIFAKTKPAFAHEVAHVCLDVFRNINSDPREGNGEPFCYLLSQILTDCW